MQNDENFETFLMKESELFAALQLNDNVRSRLLTLLRTVKSRTSITGTNVPDMQMLRSAFTNLRDETCHESGITTEVAQEARARERNRERHHKLARNLLKVFGIVIVVTNVFAPYFVPALELVKDPSVILGTLIAGT
jgi:hypothetical protein